MNVKPRQELPSIKVQRRLPQRQIGGLRPRLDILHGGYSLLKGHHIYRLNVLSLQGNGAVCDRQPIAHCLAQHRKQVTQRVFSRWRGRLWPQQRGQGFSPHWLLGQRQVIE